LKKFIVLNLSGLLIIFFSATVYTQSLDFKASGLIDTKSYWYKNIPTSSNTSIVVHSLMPIIGVVDPDFLPTAPGASKKAFDRTNTFMDSRGRLKFDAMMGKEVSGTIYFEMDSTLWGEAPGGHGGKISERGSMGAWTGDQAAVEVKNVYIDFAIPLIPGLPSPLPVRIGLQPLAIRPNILVYTDGTGISATIKIDPLTINPVWFKAVEGVIQTSDDVDIYGLNVNAKVKTLTIGGYGLYYNMNTYPLFVVTLFPLPPFGCLVMGTQRADAWWLGVYADGKMGPVDLNFDFVYDRGKVESKLTPTVPDVKYRGWATQLKVDYPWEKFNFGLVGMYASGADLRKTSASGLPGTTAQNGGALSTKVYTYVTPPGSESFAGFTEGLVYYPTWVNNSNLAFYTPTYLSMGRGAIGGTWMAKLYGSYKATPWYKLTLQGMYIGDTTEHGNTNGNAVKPGTSIPRDDKTIGWEFGLINEINLYKNVKLDIGAGILFAGDALDYQVPTTTTNKSPSSPWCITTRLGYTF
jgi:hypothetical protein